MMDFKTLEALMADRALGGLTPEVEALLEAYLGEHPEFAGVSAQIDTTVALARRAVGGPAAALPPFPGERLRSGRRRLRSRRMMGLAAAAAACVVVGVMLGRVTTGPSLAGVPKAVPPSPLVSTPFPEATIQTPVGSFWSIPSRAPVSATSATVQASDVVWDSPVRIPTLKGRS